MRVMCCYRAFGSAFLRRDAESEDARKMPDREEKAGKKQGYEKNLKKVKKVEKNSCIIMKTVI